MIHAAFAERLERYGARYTLVRGTWDQREALAAGAIETLLASTSRSA